MGSAREVVKATLTWVLGRCSHSARTRRASFIITMTSHGSYFATAIKPSVRYCREMAFRNAGETSCDATRENLSLFT